MWQNLKRNIWSTPCVLQGWTERCLPVRGCIDTATFSALTPLKCLSLHRQLSSLVMQKPHNTGSHITAQLQFSTNNSCLATFNYPLTMLRHQCMPQLAERRSVQKERVLSYPIMCVG